jgi:hypothetical protein
MHHHKTSVSKSAAKLVNAPLGNGKLRPTKVPPKPNDGPERFSYALGSYTAERRKEGWFAAKAWLPSAGEKPKWSGPFESIESLCLSIGRHLATEIADRHTRSIEFHRIAKSHPLYGLKPTTRLRPR